MNTEHQFLELHASICKSLASFTRLQIISKLINGEKVSVNELAAELSLPQSTVSRHLSVMRKSGVVNRERVGANAIYTLGGPEIIQAYQAMHAFTVRKLTENAALINELEK